MSSSADVSLAYESFRVVFIPWQRERRLAKEQERIRMARLSSTVITAGVFHSLALRRDGSIACWGRNDYRQAPPAGVLGPFATEVEV